MNIRRIFDVRVICTMVILLSMTVSVSAQKKSTKRTNKDKTKTAVTATTEKPVLADTTTPVVKTESEPAKPANDSLPIKLVKKSLRQDDAVEGITLSERSPLEYEYLRADDAIYRQKILRELDCREKIGRAHV